MTASMRRKTCKRKCTSRYVCTKICVVLFFIGQIRLFRVEWNDASPFNGYWRRVLSSDDTKREKTNAKSQFSEIRCVFVIVKARKYEIGSRRGS